MKPQADSCAAFDALLLDYAYGELEGGPRRKVEDHLSNCSRCRGALMAVAETRHAMAALTPEPAPETGLESLLSYAEQAAQQSAAERPRPSPWRWLLPALSLAGVSAGVLLLVARTSNPADRLAPASPVSVVAPASAPVMYKAAPEDLPSGTSPATGAEAKAMRLVQPERPAESGAGAAAAPEKVAERRPEPALDTTINKLGDRSWKSPAHAAGEGAKRSTEEAPSPKAEPAPPVDAIAASDKKDADRSEEKQADLKKAYRTGPREDREAKLEQKPAKGGDATGSHSFARAPAQTQVLGAADDEARRDRPDGVRTVEVMSNVGLPRPARVAAKPADPTLALAPPTPVATGSTVAQQQAGADYADSPAPAAPAVGVPITAETARTKSKQEKESGGLESGSPDELLQRAADWYARGDFSGAEALYGRFLARFPSHPRAPEAALARAAVLDRLGRAGDALGQRQEIARRWPDSKEAQATRGASGPHAAPASKKSAPAEEMDRSAPAKAADQALH